MNKIFIYLFITYCTLGCTALRNKKWGLSDRELKRLSEQYLINRFYGQKLREIQENRSIQKMYVDTTLVFRKEIEDFFKYGPKSADCSNDPYNFKPITLHIPDSLRSFYIPYRGVDPGKDTFEIIQYSPLLRTQYPDTFSLQVVYYDKAFEDQPDSRWVYCFMYKMFYKNGEWKSSGDIIYGSLVPFR